MNKEGMRGVSEEGYVNKKMRGMSEKGSVNKEMRVCLKRAV